MTNHETLQPPQTPEVHRVHGAAILDAMTAIDAERNPDFTAFEQVKGVELAKLYLQGRAADFADTAPDEYGPDSGNSPLDTVVANMRYIAGYYVIGEGAGKQITESLKPWNQAYEELTQPTE